MSDASGFRFALGLLGICVFLIGYEVYTHWTIWVAATQGWLGLAP